jgi:hypothetical protein
MPHTLQIKFSNAGSECGGSEYNRSSGVDRAGVRGVSGDSCREDGSDLIRVVNARGMGDGSAWKIGGGSDGDGAFGE